MLVSQDSMSVLPPHMFFAYQLLPTVTSWILTTCWIAYFWQKERQSALSTVSICFSCLPLEAESPDMLASSAELDGGPVLEKVEPTSFSHLPRQSMLNSPIPYSLTMILFGMIVMIFVNIMSISALVCITALIMILTVVLGNRWRGRPIRQSGGGKSSIELNEFFEDLFGSVDYALLIIFLGTFIVVGNVESTGIPRYLWQAMTGDKPFQSVMSITRISLYVLLASQFIGNVPIIQLAMPNVSPLPDEQKRLAWLILSFVATIGGNLTLTGSAGM